MCLFSIYNNLPNLYLNVSLIHYKYLNCAFKTSDIQSYMCFILVYLKFTKILILLFIFSAWDSLWPFSVLKPYWPLEFWWSGAVLRLLVQNLEAPDLSRSLALQSLSFSGSFMSSFLLSKLTKPSNQDSKLTATHDKLLIFKNICNKN